MSKKPAMEVMFDDIRSLGRKPKELDRVYIISTPDIEIYWRIEMIFQDESEANDYVKNNPGTKVHVYDVVPL